jgi:hypothetical protein
MLSMTHDVLTKYRPSLDDKIEHVSNWILSFLRDIYYMIVYYFLGIYDDKDIKLLIDKASTFPTINTSTEGMIIFLHGLNATPYQFMHQLPLYLQNKNIAIYIPRIFNKGLAPIEECGQQILTAIRDSMLTKSTSNIPIIIVGISNGGLIGMWLYPQLRTHFKNVYITTIGSPLNGTYIANFLLKTKLYKLTLYRHYYKILEGLIHDSSICKDIIKTCHKCPGFYERSMLYASTTDFVVYPYVNAIIFESEHKIISGYGHHSIIIKIMTEQYEWCKQVLENPKNNYIL